jgi:hypothetical protein
MSILYIIKVKEVTEGMWEYLQERNRVTKGLVEEIKIIEINEIEKVMFWFCHILRPKKTRDLSQP